MSDAPITDEVRMRIDLFDLSEDDVLNLEIFPAVPMPEDTTLVVDPQTYQALKNLLMVFMHDLANYKVNLENASIELVNHAYLSGQKELVETILSRVTTENAS